MNKSIIFGLIVTALLGYLSYLVWQNFLIQDPENLDEIVKPPESFSRKCGIENCHGLEIECGSNVDRECTAIYAPGDDCRQFANCEMASGQCVQVDSSRFDRCKACVNGCKKNSHNNPAEFSACEQKCAL